MYNSNQGRDPCSKEVWIYPAENSLSSQKGKVCTISQNAVLQ